MGDGGLTAVFDAVSSKHEQVRRWSVREDAWMLLLMWM